MPLSQVWATPNWGPRSGLAYSEQAITKASNRLFWTKDHVFNSKAEADAKYKDMTSPNGWKPCELGQNCWEA